MGIATVLVLPCGFVQEPASLAEAPLAHVRFLLHFHPCSTHVSRSGACLDTLLDALLQRRRVAFSVLGSCLGAILRVEGLALRREHGTSFRPTPFSKASFSVNESTVAKDSVRARTGAARAFAQLSN